MEYSFFEKIGLTKIQTEIFINLYKLGNQPASIIAKHLGLERTKVYRNLLALVNLGFVKKTQKNGIQVFFVKDVEDLSRYVDKKIENLNYLEQNKMRILDDIQKIKLQTSNMPKISIYDNSEGVGSIFDDILENIRKQKLLTIRMFASNTYMEQNENIKAEEFAKKFYDKLKKEKIHVDTFIGSGNLIMERIDTCFEGFTIGELPATQSSINLIIVGKITYIIIYNKTPQGIKIENENLADALHIMLDVAKKYDNLLQREKK